MPSLLCLCMFLLNKHYYAHASKLLSCAHSRCMYEVTGKGRNTLPFVPAGQCGKRL